MSTSSLEQKANEHVFGGGRMLVGRGVQSRRLARVWMVFAHTRRRDARFFSLRGGSSGFFLHVESAWGGTLVNSLLRVYGLLHRHWSKRVKRKSRTRPVLQSQSRLPRSPSNVIAEGDPPVSTLTDDHRPDGDALHEDGPETGSDPGVIRWCTRPSTGLLRTARAFNKVARSRQAAQMWQPDFGEYVGRIRDSLTRPSGTLPIGPRINGLRLNTERHVCGSSNPIAEVRETSCWALDLEFEAEKEVATSDRWQAC